MTSPVSEPFFLLDESLSSDIVAEVSRVTGYAISTVRDEWPGRDFNANSLTDEEIIPHLGNMSAHRAVWITGDRKALGQHAPLIDTHQISILLLRGPGRRNPTTMQQSQMLCAVLGKARSLILGGNYPVYLRVRLDPDDGYRPFLEQLRGTVLDRPFRWRRIPLA